MCKVRRRGKEEVVMVFVRGLARNANAAADAGKEKLRSCLEKWGFSARRLIVSPYSPSCWQRKR